MTATQVVVRFLKEKGYYGTVYPCLINAYYNCINTFKGLEYNKLYEKFPNKPLYVDVVLKAYKSNLNDFPLYIFRERKFSKLCNTGIINFNSFSKDFRKFIRENLNGNFLKYMIPDNIHEISHDAWGKYRNGHHVLDFTWRENK